MRTFTNTVWFQLDWCLFSCLSFHNVYVQILSQFKHLFMRPLYMKPWQSQSFGEKEIHVALFLMDGSND